MLWLQVAPKTRGDGRETRSCAFLTTVCEQLPLFTRDSICYSAYMLSPVRLSGCPSVRQTGVS